MFDVIIYTLETNFTTRERTILDDLGYGEHSMFATGLRDWIGNGYGYNRATRVVLVLFRSFVVSKKQIPNPQV